MRISDIYTEPPTPQKCTPPTSPGPIHIFTESGHSVFPVEKIRTVSTIGAGDNFNAGFLYGLLNRRRNLEEIVRTATRFSSAVCQSIYNYVDPGFNPDKSPEQP